MKRQYPASRRELAKAAEFMDELHKDQRALRTLLEQTKGGDAGCADDDDVARQAPEQATGGPCLDVGEGAE